MLLFCICSAFGVLFALHFIFFALHSLEGCAFIYFYTNKEKESNKIFLLLRDQVELFAFYGSQPNIAHNFTNNNNSNASTNIQKITPKLSKTQSFNHRKKEGISTPQLFRKLLFRNKNNNKDNSSKINKKFTKQDQFNENDRDSINGNVDGCGSVQNSRDVTSAIVDCDGAKLINEYWGVTLDIPKNAIPEGRRQEVYFVITDPRLCDSAPPLDLENGIIFIAFWF